MLVIDAKVHSLKISLKDPQKQLMFLMLKLLDDVVINLQEYYLPDSLGCLYHQLEIEKKLLRFTFNKY